MSEIKIFNNPQFGDIRIVINESGEPLFCVKDLCEILGLDSNNVVRRLEGGVFSKHPLQTAGGTQQANFVNESGLYDAIFDSRKPEAKQFRKWVTSEVLPSIRKNGAYLTDSVLEKALSSPDFLIQLATTLKEEKEKRMIAEGEISQLKPKAALMDKVLDAGEKIDIGQAAKILQLPFGRNTLFAQLREKGIFFKNKNEPKQEYLKRGYFELKEKWIERNCHDGFAVLKVLVTQKGLEFISKLFECDNQVQSTIHIN